MTAYLLERAWVDGAVHDDVLVEIEDGRFAAVELRGVWHSAGLRRPTSRSRRRTGIPDGAGPDRPRPGELPQPRLPPGPARADPARAGDVLDLARADVRRRRAARPRHLPRAGPGDLPRRWRPPGSPPWASSTTCTTSPTARRTTTRTRWACALVEAAREAGHPDRAARHLLPQRRVRRAARGCAGALRRRRRRRLGRAGGRPRGSDRPGVVLGAAIHSVRAVPARPAGDGRRGRRERAAAARPPLRAGGRERRLPGGVRRHPDAAARRRRGRSARDQRRARHPPDRRRRRAARATSGTHACFCPTTERDLGDGIGPSRAPARRGGAG